MSRILEACFCLKRGDFVLDVDLKLPGRGVSAVFGPSGCGKTSLLRAIAGLEPAAAGYLRLGEQVWQEGSYSLPTYKRPLGYVFQEASLFEHLNVKRNLEYGLRRIPSAERRISLELAIALLDIEPLLKRSVLNLSGGERQRVAIARALAVSPQILLMDEPLAALDQERKREILPYLETLHQALDIPILYVSHSLDEVAQLADHLVLLEQGKVLGSGPIAEVMTRPDLPLLHSPEAEAVVSAQVESRDEDYGLTYLSFPGGWFTLAGSALKPGQRVRLRIAARDVSVSLAEHRDSSILNNFPVILEQILPENKTQVTLRLLAGGVPLLARITRKSAVELKLRPGQALQAHIKSVALWSSAGTRGQV